MAATQLPRRRRRKNLTTTELPLDVIFNNILPRLPASYVMKFLRVSKQWCSFLKSPMFVKMHLDHVTNDDHQNHHKLLVLYEKETTSTFSYSNRDCETQEPGMRRRRPLPFEDTSGDISITSSCNGLVLVALRNDNDAMLLDLIIWNPLTNDYKTLSETDHNIVYYDTIFELYYNSSEQDYRVLLITEKNDVYIYSLKSDSWREINFECIPYSIPLGLSPCTCWPERLYVKRYRVFDSITMFDTQTEKFTNISTPFQVNLCSRVIIQRGCVYICQRNWCIKLWSMDRLGVWGQVSAYKCRAVKDVHLLEPLHLMGDGNWLMKPDERRKYYSKADLENKHNEGGSCSYKLQGFVAEVYIETFVSPNQYMN